MIGGRGGPLVDGVASRGGLVSRGRLVGRGRLVVTSVLDIGNIARVVIGNMVGDSLGAAVGEEDIVGALGGIAITGLIGTEPHIAVVAVLGINSILVGVEGRSLLVGGGRGIAGVGGGSHGGKSKEGDEGLHVCRDGC